MSSAEDCHLWQDHRGIWNARKRRKGKEFNKCLDTKSKTVARERARVWLDGLIASEWGEKPKRTFNAAAEKFAEDYFPNMKAPERYATSLVHLIEFFNGYELDKITPSKLDAFVQWRRKAGVQSSTIRRDLSCLSSLFTNAQVWEWTLLNPVRPFLQIRSKTGLAENEGRQRVMSHDEEAVLERYLPDRVRFAMAMLVDTAVRKSEFTTATWQQVALDLPAVKESVRARGQLQLYGKTTKSKRTRAVPLLDRAYDMLRFAERKAVLIFPREDGAGFTKTSPYLWETFTKVARKHDILDLTLHDLRRTGGCRLLQEYRMSMEGVSTWLGHSSVKVTEKHYAFLKVDQLHDEVERGRENVVRLAERRKKSA